MTPTQLAIDFGHRPAFSAGDFVVAPCNAEAHGWISRWPGWPESALVLTGPAGSGKSHLSHLLVEKSGGIAVPARSLSPDDPPGLATKRAVVVEDADRGFDERALLHLYNYLKQGGGSLLVTARTSPSRWGIGLADLRSRLLAVPTTAIGAPDDALLKVLLAKLFFDRQLRVGEDVLDFLVLRMERSFDAARSLVAVIDTAALAEGREISIPLVRQALAVSPPGISRE